MVRMEHKKDDGARSLCGRNDSKHQKRLKVVVEVLLQEVGTKPECCILFGKVSRRLPCLLYLKLLEQGSS